MPSRCGSGRSEMLNFSRVCFIGSGTMAEAMIKGMLAQRLVAPGAVIASGPRAERGAELSSTYGVQVTSDNLAALPGADLVVISVKPQVLPGVLTQLAGRIPEKALVLSLAAGARLAALAQGLKHTSLVRSMPNTPAQIGQGMTVWTASAAVSEAQREQARAVLGALGEEVFVEDEDYLDMATALSGTGPAYVFLLMEGLVDAGVHLGFPRYLAEKLGLQTGPGARRDDRPRAPLPRRPHLHPSEPWPPPSPAAQTPTRLACPPWRDTCPSHNRPRPLLPTSPSGFRALLTRPIPRLRAT